jgi:hypothetical protein
MPVSPDRLDEMQMLASAAGQPLWVIGETVEGLGIEVVL